MACHFQDKVIKDPGTSVSAACTSFLLDHYFWENPVARLLSALRKVLHDEQLKPPANICVNEIRVDPSVPVKCSETIAPNDSSVATLLSDTLS